MQNREVSLVGDCFTDIEEPKNNKIANLTNIDILKNVNKDWIASSIQVYYIQHL